MYKNYGAKVEGDVPTNEEYDDFVSEQSLREAESGVAYERMIDAWAFMQGQE